MNKKKCLECDALLQLENLKNDVCWRCGASPVVFDGEKIDRYSKFDRLLIVLATSFSLLYVGMEFTNGKDNNDAQCKGVSLKKYVKKELKDRGYTKVSIFKPMIENTVKENYKDETYWFVDINAKIKMGDITLPKKERLWCVCSEQGWFIAEAQQKY